MRLDYPVLFRSHFGSSFNSSRFCDSSFNMVFTIVQHDEVFPQDFGVRRIDLRILCQQVYLAMGGVVRDFCSRFHYPRETARAQRLYSALVGYAVTSTAMIAHSVINSQSLLSYRGPEEPICLEREIQELFLLK